MMTCGSESKFFIFFKRGCHDFWSSAKELDAVGSFLCIVSHPLSSVFGSNNRFTASGAETGVRFYSWRRDQVLLASFFLIKRPCNTIPCEWITYGGDAVAHP